MLHTAHAFLGDFLGDFFGDFFGDDVSEGDVMELVDCADSYQRDTVGAT